MSDAPEWMYFAFAGVVGSWFAFVTVFLLMVDV